MITTLKNLALTGLLTLCTAYGIKLMFTSTPIRLHSSNELNHTRDFYMINIEAQNFDKSGKLAMQLKAKQVDHYPENNTSHINEPDIKLYKNGASLPISIKADHGTALHGTEKIELRQNVNIFKPSEDAKSTLSLFTHHLDFYPKTKDARCDNTVFIKQGGLSVIANGLTANLDKKTMQLNHPKATYEKK